LKDCVFHGSIKLSAGANKFVCVSTKLIQLTFAIRYFIKTQATFQINQKQ